MSDQQDGGFSPQYAPPPGSRPLRPAALELAERQLPRSWSIPDRWFFWLIAAPVTGLAAWEIFSCAQRQPVWLTAVLSVASGVLVARLWRLRPWRRPAPAPPQAVIFTSRPERSACRCPQVDTALAGPPLKVATAPGCPLCTEHGYLAWLMVHGTPDEQSAACGLALISLRGQR